MSVKYAILGLLHYRDMHGYKIKKHIEQNFGHMWSINYGQIYPALKKLEQDGLVSVAKVIQKGRPSKKLYSITPDGKNAFRSWLDSNPEKRMLLRDPFLTRFVFFGFGSKNRALETIEEQIKLYEEQIKRRQDNLIRWQNQDIYVRLIAELGVKLNEIFLNWLIRARSEISNSKDEDSHAYNTQTVGK